MSKVNINNKTKWTDEEVSLLKKEYPQKEIKEILKLFPNRTYDQIINKAWRLNLRNKKAKVQCGWTSKWSVEEDNLLIENYSKFNIEELEKMFPNRNKSGIQQRAQKLGLKYLYYDKDYFNKIDSSEKAYWLGFIYADGYVSSQERFGIELSIVDIEHLQKFAKALNSNIRIKTRVRDGRELCNITIKNSEIHNDLIDKGVFYNKTNNIHFPTKEQLPEKYIKDFIRGFFDGDGCYLLYEHNQKNRYKDSFYECPVIAREISAVCLAEDFLKSIQKILKENADCDSKIYIQKRSDRNYLDLPILRIMKKNDIIKFINYVFYEDCVCLDRKKEIAKELLKNCLA